jgi:hypothetical protein
MVLAGEAGRSLVAPLDLATTPRASEANDAFHGENSINPHFSHPFYCGLFFPVVAAFRLLTPRAGCSHTALRPSRRAPCHTGKFPHLVKKSVGNAG